MKITITTPTEVTHSPLQPEVKNLSVDEIRNCFPCNAEIFESPGSSIVLTEAPSIGLIIHLLELISESGGDSGSRQVQDFYGEYRLTLTRAGGMANLTNSLTNDRVQALWENFVSEACRVAENTLVDIEEMWPEILGNSNYIRIREFVESVC